MIRVVSERAGASNNRNNRAPLVGRRLQQIKETAAPALEELYRAFFLRLVRRAYWRYGLSKEDAREVVHDAFLLALVKLNVERNPQAWLYGVVDRLSANWRRKAIRRSHLNPDSNLYNHLTPFRR